MGAGDLLGDLGEGRIIHTGIFEAVFRHRDGVRASMPFAYEPGAWLQAEAGMPAPWLDGLAASGPDFALESLPATIQ